jgi:ubiquinone/menaquinone biosynthesis C-methylase UbiE
MSQLINTRQAAVWGGELGQQWANHDERYDALLEGFNDALIAAADIGKHDARLDIGCGTGQTTRLAARIASHGHATGIDISAAMLERARAVAEREHVQNVTFVQGDAEVYPFAGEAFDAVISRGGVMFFADPVAAFRNILRAMRSGGRLALVAPRRPQPGSELAGLFAPLAPIPVASELDAEMDRAMYSLSDPDDIVILLRAAGFRDVQVEAAEAPVC